MKVTTGFDFQGYVIVDYIDVIFDEMLVGLGLGKGIMSSLDNMFSSITGTEATQMIDKLNRVKSTLRTRVEDKARRTGANALIGIDFESSKLGDLIMVSMTATAVKIERIADYTPGTVEQKRKDEQKRQEEEKQIAMDNAIKEIIDNSEDNSVQLIAGFLAEGEKCARFSDVKILWDKLPIQDTPLKEKIDKELNNRLYIEKMYGGTNEKKIHAFCSTVTNFLR